MVRAVKRKIQELGYEIAENTSLATMTPKEIEAMNKQRSEEKKALKLKQAQELAAELRARDESEAWEREGRNGGRMSKSLSAVTGLGWGRAEGTYGISRPL